MPDKHSTKRLLVLLAAAAALRLAGATQNLPNGLFDDAYTTLRYASNLSRGLGLVFNPGERVLGTSSPLLAFILAAAAKVVGTSHLEGIVVSVGILASLGMLYLCDRILTLADVTPSLKWVYLAALAFLPAFVANAVSGMETPVVLFLMAWSLYLAVLDRKMALAAVAILLFLSRADTFIWLTVLAAHLWWQRRQNGVREFVKPALLFLSGSGAWLIFSRLYFGGAVPQSFVGKTVSHGVFAQPDWQYVLTLLSAFVPARFLGIWGLPVIAIVLLLMIRTSRDFCRDYPALAPVVWFFPLYVLILGAIRFPLFSWYLMPAKWAFYLPAAYVVWRAASLGRRVFHMPIEPAHVMNAAAVALLIVGTVSAFRGAVSPRQPNTWLAVSNLIEERSEPEARVFLEHIGLVGYHSGRYVFDYIGLVTPQTTDLRQRYRHDWLTRATRQYDADIVVLYQGDVPAFQSEQDADAAWFRDQYQHVRDYGSVGVVASVYFKKNSPRIVRTASEPQLGLLSW